MSSTSLHLAPVRELGPTGVQKRIALYAQSRSGGNRAGKGGKVISLMSCKTWERQKEGADMRLEEIKGKLHLCLIITFFCECTYECSGY